MASSEKPTPIIRWPGGKRLMAKHVVPKLPAHRVYVEPFGGGMAVLLAKAPSKVEVYNDLNGDLVNLFRIVKYHPLALADEISLTLNSREEMMSCLAQPGVTDLQRAARFLRTNHLSFGGIQGRGFACAGAARSRSIVAAQILALNKRLDRVAVEHLDWRRCMALYDGPGTCFYLDPPYADGDQRIYVHGFGEQDHRDLRAVLDGLQGQWVLSYGDHPLIRDLYRDCQVQEIQRTRTINNRATKPYTELLIAA